MARKANFAGSTEPTEEEKDVVEGAPLGEPLENAVTEVGGAKVSAAVPAPAEPAHEVPVKKYEVFGAGANGKYVQLGGYRCLFRDGKIVEDKDYDIEALHQQGVSLRELKG